MTGNSQWSTHFSAIGVVPVVGAMCALALADGKLQPPRDYRGSLEELSQEAIIIFHGADEPGEATEDLILKIGVRGDVSQFAWIVPLPNEPETKPEDAELFEELFDYVQHRSMRRSVKNSKSDGKAAPEAANDREAVTVLSREIVGSYDVSIVKENVPGALNQWLANNDYQPLEDAEDVLEFYREKGYVYACMRVSDAKLQGDATVDLHPLRFTFKTDGRDGIYFPMKLTGTQTEPFNVNLYVFYGAWLNDELNKFGYTHRGFRLNFRDWDTRECEANAGKSYSNPEGDPYLRNDAHRIPSVKRLFQKLHPGERYYLTNIQAIRLEPRDVRDWSDDLWLFPHYTNRSVVPYDVRDNGPASGAWPNETADSLESQFYDTESIPPGAWISIGIGTAVVLGTLIGIAILYVRHRQANAASR
jgi:hypothetical protein